MKKICTKCGIEKDFNSFWNDKNRQDWKTLYCKECSNIIWKIRKHILRRKKWILERISNDFNYRICTKCWKNKHIDNYTFLKIWKYWKYPSCMECERHRNVVYRIENKEKTLKYWKEYNKKYPEKRRQTWVKYRIKNTEKIKIKNKTYRINNRDKIDAKDALRRWRKKNQTPNYVTMENTAFFFKLRDIMSDIFQEPYHVDHIIPIAKWWLHCHFNLQVLRWEENLKKSDKLNYAYTI